jgi:hypothetical protein
MAVKNTVAVKDTQLVFGGSLQVKVARSNVHPVKGLPEGAGQV